MSRIKVKRTGSTATMKHLVRKGWELRTAEPKIFGGISMGHNYVLVLDKNKRKAGL